MTKPDTIFIVLTCISFALLTIAFVLTLIRAILGPRITHHVIALDLMANIIIGVAAGYAMWRHQIVYLSMVIGLALVIFLGTVAYAQYIESRIERQDHYD